MKVLIADPLKRERHLFTEKLQKYVNRKEAGR